MIRSPKLCRQPRRPMTSRPDGLAVGRLQLRGAGGAARRAALGARRACRFAEPADVALAPGGDAVAQPVLLGGDLAGELVAGRAPPAPAPRRARPRNAQSRGPCGGWRRGRARPSARQPLQQPPVVADQHHRRAQAGQLRLQPGDRRAGRDGWSARRAAGCRAPGPARAPARRAGPRRRTGARGPPRRSGRAAPAGARARCGSSPGLSPAST